MIPSPTTHQIAFYSAAKSAVGFPRSAARLVNKKGKRAFPTVRIKIQGLIEVLRIKKSLLTMLSPYLIGSCGAHWAKTRTAANFKVRVDGPLDHIQNERSGSQLLLFGWPRQFTRFGRVGSEFCLPPAGFASVRTCHSSDRQSVRHLGRPKVEPLRSGG